ncbi:MAG: hypothetical protein ACT4TC_16005, partial [Myxococcaceae bacterium]
MGRILVTSSSAAARLSQAETWLRARKTDEELLLVGGSVDGVSDLARRMTAEKGATFGWQRLSLRRLALRLAERGLHEQGLTAATPLGLEANRLSDRRCQPNVAPFSAVILRAR